MDSFCFCRVLVCLVLLFSVIGCGGGDSGKPAAASVPQKEVYEFAKAYLGFMADHGSSAPKKIEDLDAGKAAFPTVYGQAKSGDFIVVWNAALSESGRENDKVVIAYEKKVPEQGGVILFGGGTVRQVTAAAFKEETIAKTKAGSQSKAPEQEAPGWKETVSKEAGFSVLLPATGAAPKSSTQTKPSPQGNVIVHSLGVEHPSKTALQVAVFTYPKQALKGMTDEQRLEKNRDGLLASLQGELRKDEKITLDKHAGRALEIAMANDVVAQIRIYVVGNRNYSLMVLGPKGAMSQAEADKFLNSFKLAAN